MGGEEVETISIVNSFEKFCYKGSWSGTWNLGRISFKDGRSYSIFVCHGDTPVGREKLIKN